MVGLRLASLTTLAFAVDGKRFNGHVHNPESRKHQHILSPRPHEDPATLASLPQTWDWRNVDGTDYTSTTKNQHQPGPGYCGACWAFATVGHLNARFNIARGNAWPRTELNHQVLVTCGPNLNNGCAGSEPSDAMKFIHEFGLPDESCHTYQGQNLVCDPYNVCQDCMTDFHPVCWHRRKFPLYRIKEYGSILPEGNISSVHKEERQLAIDGMVTRMKAEIFKRGPMVCQIACPDPMPAVPYSEWPPPANATYGNWRGYMDDYTPYFNDGGENFDPFILDLDFPCPSGNWDECVDHDVNVVGWGEEAGRPYWLIQNSWGEWWGEAGYVRVLMGHNTLGIESACFWGVPDLDGMTTDSLGHQRFPMGTPEVFAERFEKSKEMEMNKVEVLYE